MRDFTVLESLRTLRLNVLKAAWNKTRSQGSGVDCIGIDIRLISMVLVCGPPPII